MVDIDEKTQDYIYWKREYKGTGYMVKIKYNLRSKNKANNK